MGYQVIARKYRPQRFESVVGQDHVTVTLVNAIRQKRIAHAYLFCGPRGTGKTTIARIFAKCLNAADGPRVDFDEDDPHAREIAEGRSLDVIEIDGASNRGIEEIRELRDTVRYAPATSRFKIYIIDEVHMLTKEAFNALLKTLEEPPAHVKFMFATTEPEKVLPTILSRCQRFDLRRIPAALIVKHLAHIARLENVTLSQTALFAIARGADGGMRDAESALDQLISFCGDRIGEEDVLAMFGLVAHEHLLELTRAVLAGQIEPALRRLDELARHGKDLGRLLADLLSHFRNLLVYRLSSGDPSLLEVSEAERTALAEEAPDLDPDVVRRILEVMIDCESRLRDTPSKRILIEVALLRAIETRRAVSLNSVLETLERLRPGRSPAGTAPSEPGMTGAPPASLARRRQPLPSAEEPDVSGRAVGAASAMARGTDLAALWTEIREAAGRVSPFLKGHLLAAHVVGFENRLLTVGFDPEFADQLELVDTTANRTLLQTKLKESGYGDCQVRFVKADRPVVRTETAAAGASPATATGPSRPTPGPTAAAKPAPPAPADPSDFKNDPVIRRALEVFRGRIVDVRSA